MTIVGICMQNSRAKFLKCKKKKREKKGKKADSKSPHIVSLGERNYA